MKQKKGNVKTMVIDTLPYLAQKIYELVQEDSAIERRKIAKEAFDALFEALAIERESVKSSTQSL